MPAAPTTLPQSPTPSGEEVAPSPTPIARPDPLYHTVILVLCAGVMILSLLLSVREEHQVLVPLLGAPLPELCMTKRFTGMGCPGCGMTRSFISLAHGDLRAALHYNPAGPLLFAIMAIQVPFRGVQLARIRRGQPELRVGWLTQILFGILGVLMVGQWMLRQFGVTF